MSSFLTPKKEVDQIDLIKQALAAKWGLALPPRDPTLSPSQSGVNGLADKIHSKIQYLYFKGLEGDKSPSLNEALEAFDQHAPALISQWVRKPAGEPDVVPSPTTGHQRFLRGRRAPSERDHQVLMDCLYNKLCHAAESLRLKSLRTVPLHPHTIASTVEVSETMLPRPPLLNRRPNSDNPNAAPTLVQKSKSQAKIDLFFRNKSAPNNAPSSSASDEFPAHGLDLDTLMTDIDQTTEAVRPPSIAASLQEAKGRESDDNFHTPPTTPGSPTKLQLPPANDGMMKPPSMLPIQRKRASEDEPTLVQPRKASRESIRRVTNRPLTRSFTEPSLEDTPSSSQQTEATKNSFSTTATSNATSPNTSFMSDLYSNPSVNTSFDASSDIDVTLRQRFDKPLAEIDRNVNASPTKNDQPTAAPAPLEIPIPENQNSVQVLIDSLCKSSPFGQGVPHEYLKIPFRQLYEVSRVALACDLELSAFSSVLKTEIEHYDQLWARLRSIVHSKGAMVPEPSSRKAWELSSPNTNNVAYSGKLVFNNQKGAPLFRLKLSPLRIEDSHRLWRKYQGDRFIDVKLPVISRKSVPSHLHLTPEIVHEAVVYWLTYTKHSLLGRQWQVFFGRDDRNKKQSRTVNNSKEKNYRIHMFAEDGFGFLDSPRIGEPETRYVEHVKCTALDVIEWFMPPDRNLEKSALKLFARLALAVSKTKKTVVFKPHQIFYVEDAYNSDPKPRKIDLAYSQKRRESADVLHPKGVVMNDGCARISRAAARAVADHLGLVHVPCAFQGRFSGAKGMWIVDFTNELPTPQAGNFWIEISESQIKFESHSCDTNTFSWPDPDRVTFEVNDYIKSLAPSGLNFQLMPILENGGVPRDVFRTTVRDQQTVEISGMQAAMDDGVSLRLWNQRHNSLEDRVQGQAAKMAGGVPQLLSQKIDWAVESGFSPDQCKFLRDMLYKSIHAYCLRLEQKMDVRIGQSCFPFIIADPLGILEEGEVHLAFSGSFNDPSSGFDATVIRDMDVLVARMPAHSPSDIQRVRAVCRPELLDYQDVVVFSTKGSQPLAAFLSGGDYDGDRVWFCWDQKIVENFANEQPQPELSPETFGIQKDKAKVSDFVDRKHFTLDFIHHGLKFNLRPNMLGTCTFYHERYCYNNRRLNDPEAMKIAQLLGLLVDSAKGGFIFDESLWAKYIASNGLPTNLRTPAYRDPDCSRPTNHLIDVLVGLAKTVKDEALEHFTRRYKGADNKDDDLSALRHTEHRKARDSPHLRSVLAYLEAELKSINDEWSRNVGRSKGEKSMKRDHTDFAALFEAANHCRSKFLAIEPIPIDTNVHISSDRILDWKEQHVSGQDSYWDLLKASVAYFKWPNSTFAWYIAGLELGEIKARSRGRANYRMVQEDIHRVLKVNGRLVDGLKKREDQEQLYDALAAMDDSDDDDYDENESEFGSSSWVEFVPY